MKLIFVSAPYSHNDDAIKEKRLEAVEKYIAHLSRLGYAAYNPTAALIYIAKKFGLPTDYSYWKEHCGLMVGKSDEFHILMEEGWVISDGVAGELGDAHEEGKEVFYVDPVTYETVNEYAN